MNSNGSNGARIAWFLISLLLMIVGFATRTGNSSNDSAPLPAADISYEELVAAITEGDVSGGTDEVTASANSRALRLLALEDSDTPAFEPNPLPGKADADLGTKPVLTYDESNGWNPPYLAVFPPTFVQFENTTGDAIVIDFDDEQVTPLRVPAGGSSSLDFGRVAMGEYTFGIREGIATGTVDTRSADFYDLPTVDDSAPVRRIVSGSGRISLELPDTPEWHIITSFDGIIMSPAGDTAPSGSFQRNLASDDVPWTPGLAVFYDHLGSARDGVLATLPTKLGLMTINDCPSRLKGTVAYGSFTGRDAAFHCDPTRVTYTYLNHTDMDGVIYVTAVGMSDDQIDQLIDTLQTLEYSDRISLTDLEAPVEHIATTPLSAANKVGHIDIVDNQFGEYARYGLLGWESELAVGHYSGEPGDLYVSSFHAATLVAGSELTIPFDWLATRYAFLEFRINPFIRSLVVIDNGRIPDIDTDWFSSTDVPVLEMTNQILTTPEGDDVSVELLVPDGWRSKDGAYYQRAAAADDPAYQAWYLNYESTSRLDQMTQWLWEQPEYLDFAVESPYDWSIARFEDFDGRLTTIAQTWHESASISLEISSGPADHEMLIEHALLPSIESFSITG